MALFVLCVCFWFLSFKKGNPSATSFCQICPMASSDQMTRKSSPSSPIPVAQKARQEVFGIRG